MLLIAAVEIIVTPRVLKRIAESEDNIADCEGSVTEDDLSREVTVIKSYQKHSCEVEIAAGGGFCSPVRSVSRHVTLRPVNSEL
ncbi:MAG: hypothetical protein A07HR60_02884 [uncultured archaeon A07HR60]|nr:MAG: hypothetical protein A07HR60_02884 [uncultured archaeon A07HR60]